VGEQHGHRLFDQTRPTIPTGIIRDLLVNQTCDQRSPQVNVARIGDAMEGKQLMGIG
jgi:hypothetical protein